MKKRNYQREYRLRNKEKHKEWCANNNQKVRMLCLQHYSGSEEPFCRCCGEKEIKFLSIDHIDGGGSQHRKSINGTSKGGNMYHWLKQNDFPEGFQILCHNCNMAKGFYGVCPHEKMV